jgi:tRNA (guanine37-N1)-methyltransferase
LVSTAEVTAGSGRTLLIDVVTLFPEMFAVLSQGGVARRALAANAWSLHLWNPRDFTHDRHRTVDDRPFGGGPGMVMMPGPLAWAAAMATRASGVGSAGAGGNTGTAGRAAGGGTSPEGTRGSRKG